MGLDLTLLPHKHHHVSGTPFLCESLRMDRDYDLFGRLRACPSREAGSVEVHSDDGWRRTDGDPYGDPIRYALAGDLAAVLPADVEVSPWNAAVIAFVRALPADVPVYLWWH